jgi:tetratricopeptide (TPR) repeat protein
VSYEIPDGELRATPNNPNAMRQAVGWLQGHAEQSDEPVERARYLGLVGVYAGMIREHETAKSALDDAISIADAHGDARQQATLRIRLADIHALSGCPEEALEILTDLVHRCTRDGELESLVDFVHQHLGKALLETGEIESGVGHLERARDLRLAKGDEELLSSTDQALAVAMKMKLTGYGRRIGRHEI